MSHIPPRMSVYDGGNTENVIKVQSTKKNLKECIKKLTSNQCLSHDTVEEDTNISYVAASNSPGLTSLLNNDGQNHENKQTQPLHLKRMSLENGPVNDKILITGCKKRKINQPRQIRSKETSFNESLCLNNGDGEVFSHFIHTKDVTHAKVELPSTLVDLHEFEKLAQELKEEVIKSVEIVVDSRLKTFMSKIFDKGTPNTPNSQNNVTEIESDRFVDINAHEPCPSVVQNKCVIKNGERNNRPNKVSESCNTTVKDRSGSNSVLLTSIPTTIAKTIHDEEHSFLEHFCPVPMNLANVQYKSVKIDLIKGIKKSGELRKAKLMFFWVRYPNSKLLKECFPGRKTNTAQIVKWFSNFREYFYKTIVNAARNIAGDLCADTYVESAVGYKFDSTITSELIRVFNGHYNHENKEIPQSFQAVVVKTLGEFVKAIQKGKDKEQSWKKSIYKNIAHLDEQLPDYFRTKLFD